MLSIVVLKLSETSNFTTALAVFFASYHVFNIEYPAKAATSLEFIQRCWTAGTLWRYKRGELWKRTMASFTSFTKFPMHQEVGGLGCWLAHVVIQWCRGSSSISSVARPWELTRPCCAMLGAAGPVAAEPSPAGCPQKGGGKREGPPAAA